MKLVALEMVWIAVGGAAGSVSRFVVTRWVQQLLGAAFPYGTMLVNVLGCLAIGFLAERFAVTLIAPQHRLAVLVGLLGGFTTFSTFSYETLEMLERGRTLYALGNIFITVLACLAACWLGQRIARGVMS